MIIDNNNLFVDTDALTKLTEIKKPADEVTHLINKLFKKINKKALLHPLVYGNEVFTDRHILLQLIKQKTIEVPTIEDVYSNDDVKKQYYIMYVSEFYNMLNDQTIPVDGDDVLKYWKAKESLGESHAIAACVLNECDLFLSDDSDSKTLEKMIEKRQMGTLHVYNRSEIVNFDGAAELSRAEKRLITHQ